ncbi:MAG: translocation/assembly module TamB domain-containing protein [Marinilabiliaceae bacterium]|nr:translocation/assembly module TamB domain-containing protein [Marinilabiliaceae bacterium]
MNGGKIIKKFIKIGGSVVLGMLLFLLLLMTISLFPPVQTRLAQWVANGLSHHYQTTITVEKVWFAPLSRLVIEGVTVMDQYNDTLASVQHISATIDLPALRHRIIHIKKLVISAPHARIARQDEGYNFSFLIDSTRQDTSRFDWDIRSNHIQVKKGRCTIQLNDSTRLPNRFDAAHLDVSDIHFVTNQLRINSDTLLVRLQQLSLREQSGFTIQKGRINLYKGKESLVVTRLRLETGASIVRLDSCHIALPNDSTGNNTWPQTRLYANLLPSLIAPSDVAYFVPLDANTLSPLTLTGQFSGSIENFKGKHVEVSYGTHTLLKSSFDIMGLPNINETFVFLDIHQLQTHPEDINALLASFPNAKMQRLPPWAQNLGSIQYKGNFTGFVNDLVAYGTFKTDLGYIRTDLGLKYTDRLLFSGSLRTIGFNIGKMLDMHQQMGRITMKMSVNGSHTNKNNYFAYLQGGIDSVNVRGYTYQNIRLNGLLANQKFDGQVDMTDPNGQLNFSGNMDFSGERSTFNFFARVMNMRPDRLNLTPALPDSRVSFDLISNFEAATPDDMTGFIRLNNGVFHRPDKVLRIDSLVVAANRRDDKKLLTVQSDIIDATIDGKYNFIYFSDALQRIAAHYLPALPDEKNTPAIPVNHFDYTIHAKKLGTLLNFFDPEISLSDSCHITGSIHSGKHLFKMQAVAPHVAYHGAELSGLQLDVNSNGHLMATLQSENLRLFNMMNLRGFATSQTASQNRLTSSITWDNQKTMNHNAGTIDGTTTFTRNEQGLVSRIALNASRAVVNDSTWHLRPAVITFAPDEFAIEDFSIRNADRQFAIAGNVRTDGHDALSGYIRNIELADITNNLDIDALKLSGILNGEFKATGLHTTPSIIGDITIDGLHYHQARLGDLSVSSSWGNDEKALIIDTRLIDQGQERLNGGGYYSVDKHTIAYQADVEQLNVSFVDYWISTVMQNFQGKASGIIGLNGPLSAPAFTARVNVDDSHFDVDYLKTGYTLQDSVFLDPTRIAFINMTMRDKYQHKGMFKGEIKHDNFSNLRFDLDIMANNMLVLDTRPKDNPTYYGTIYTTGNMNISGNTDLVTLYVKAQTMPNTQFNIPMNDNTEVSQTNYIQFAAPQKELVTTTSQPVAANEASGFEMEMNLKVTPDAKTQIIFDARSGDILKAAGKGDLQMKIDTKGKFSMYGDYVIEDGDYLFSLQNLINKKFSISKGSRIQWDGEPYNAMIRLEAAYKLRASLYDLVGGSMMDEASASELKKRVPVTCSMNLSDRLNKPNIKLGIHTPSLEASSQNIIREYIQTEEEMNRQVLSLLVMNRFYSANMQKSENQNQGGGVNSAALVTTSEMLSNQLNHWLSQITSDVDMGISYRPGDEISSREVEVALSTQLFNDRLTVNGNVGYSEYPTDTKTNNLIGDFDMNLKLNRSGSVSAHAYTRTNNDILYTNLAPTKQGVGLTFRQEFDNWLELMKKYWAIVTGENRKRKTVTESEDETQKR